MIIRSYPLFRSVKNMEEFFMDKTSLLNDLQFIFSIIGLPSAIYFIIIMIKGRRNISWRQIKKVLNI